MRLQLMILFTLSLLLTHCSQRISACRDANGNVNVGANVNCNENFASPPPPPDPHPQPMADILVSLETTQEIRTYSPTISLALTQLMQELEKKNYDFRFAIVNSSQLDAAKVNARFIGTTSSTNNAWSVELGNLFSTWQSLPINNQITQSALSLALSLLLPENKPWRRDDVPLYFVPVSVAPESWAGDVVARQAEALVWASGSGAIRFLPIMSKGITDQYECFSVNQTGLQELSNRFQRLSLSACNPNLGQALVRAGGF